MVPGHVLCFDGNSVEEATTVKDVIRSGATVRAEKLREMVILSPPSSHITVFIVS
jgi:hypothetical protein